MRNKIKKIAPAVLANSKGIIKSKMVLKVDKPFDVPTYREYKVLGSRLKRLNELLVHQIVETGKKEGKQATKGLYIALKGLDAARSLLDDNFHRDFPKCSEIDIFYGKR